MTKLENLTEILEANPEGSAFLYVNSNGFKKIYMIRGILDSYSTILSWTIVGNDQVAQMFRETIYAGVQNKNY